MYSTSVSLVAVFKGALLINELELVIRVEGCASNVFWNKNIQHDIVTLGHFNASECCIVTLDQ